MLLYLKHWWLKSKVWVGIAFAVIGTILSAWLIGKREGRQEEKISYSEKEVDKIAETAKNELIRNKAETENTVEKIQNANEVKNETSNLSDDAVINELRNKWSRD